MDKQVIRIDVMANAYDHYFDYHKVPASERQRNTEFLFWKYIDIDPGNYSGEVSGWRVDQRTAQKIQGLASPNFHAIMKAYEILENG